MTKVFTYIRSQRRARTTRPRRSPPATGVTPPYTTSTLHVGGQRPAEEWSRLAVHDRVLGAHLVTSILSKCCHHTQGRKMFSSLRLTEPGPPHIAR